MKPNSQNDTTANASDLHEELRVQLRREYCRRRAANHSYSLNRFAKYLGISSGSLTEILSGRRQVGLRVYKRLVDRLGPNEGANPHTGVGVPSAASTRTNGASSGSELQYRTLTWDEYALVSDWYHNAIVDLTEIKGFQSDPKWIAERLGISRTECEDALSRLRRLGLIYYKRDRIYASSQPYTSTCDVPSAAIREAMRQELSLANDAIEHVPVNDRDMSSISLTFKKSDMADAKEMIKTFRREFAARFGKREAPDDVYMLALQLIPMRQYK